MPSKHLRKVRGHAAPCDHAFDVVDLAQEIAIAVYCGRHYFRPERGKLTAWLGRVTVRTAWAVRKSAHTSRRRGSRVTRCCDEMPELPDTADRLQYTGDCWTVVTRVLELKEVRVLVMRFAEDLDLKQIGARLGATRPVPGG